MKKKAYLYFLFFIFFLAFLPLRAQSKYTPKVEKYKLSNGITLLVVQRDDSPTIACYRFQKTGSINEYPGISGAAHLLEHMMFKGTKNYGTWNYKAELPIMTKIDKLVDEIDRERAKGLNDYQKVNKVKIARLWKEIKKLQKEQSKYIRKNEYDSIMSAQGGRGNNASTSFDQTDYYINVPSNKLEVWAYLDSDRLKNPVLREFYSERNVVYEERRMYMNKPSGVLFENFMTTIFKTFPYGHEIVGFASDIETMKRDQIREFMKNYYSPLNTIIVLVGDIKPKDAYGIVNKYYGSIPSRPNSKPVFETEPPQKGERRSQVYFDSKPQVLIGFHGPKPGNADQYPLEILGYILSEGRTSRFHKNLIRKNIAYECFGGLWTMAFTNIFVLEGSPKKGVSSKQLEEALYKEIDSLKKEPVSKWEIQKILNQMEKGYINSLENKMNLASKLAWYEAWTGDWRNFDTRKKLKSVTPADIMRVAKKYLNKSNRTVITLVPTKKINN